MSMALESLYAYFIIVCFIGKNISAELLYKMQTRNWGGIFY